MSTHNFQGKRVLILESRRAKEMATIVTAYGGVPITAPSMREIPLSSNSSAAEAADAVIRGDFGMVILLTGVGARAWLDVVEQTRGSNEKFVHALRLTPILCRGPKPLAVMRELNVPVWGTAAEPNTWREVLALIDEQGIPEGIRVAVQEYGASNPELLDGLEQRGVRPSTVRVYQWGLPVDLGPLRQGIRDLVDGRVDVTLFTSAVQMVHLERVAADMGLEGQLVAALRRTRVASIGPTTSEELRRHRVEPTLEASHPKMGFLVREAAAQ